MRHDLPQGAVTFVFTDIEGSTSLLHELGAERYGELLSQHHRVCRAAWVEHGGVEVDTAGDAFFVAFQTASGALAAAGDAQEALAALGLRVRMGVHTGEVTVGETGYVGFEVHRAARIAAAAHGGQVVVSSSTAALVGPNGLMDLGEHRFKDLAAPERVFQLGSGEFRPLQSLYRSNLPVPATPFLGRERELGEVVELLGRPHVRLLTLTGPGGTGKTRLALQAAAEASDAFPDGVFWVALAPLRDPALVPSAVAHALGVMEQPGQDLVALLVAWLTDKRLMLLLDNAEHLLPELARTLSHVHAAGGQPLLMVTSRERLQVTGEQVYPVPELEPREGVELFVARAAGVGVMVDRTASVTGLCARLEHLPLALELAAARMVVFSPEQLVERLAQRLDLLKGGRDVDPRQQTLRATIEWSYELLDEDERRLLRGLSVFAGGCTYEAAEAVCDADPDTLQSLVDKSLVRRRIGGSGEPRYWMLETIREFAAEGLLDKIRSRHASYFLALTQKVHDKRADADAGQWLAVLDGEYANCVAALKGLRERNEIRYLVSFETLIAQYRYIRGLIGEGRDGLERALALGADEGLSSVAAYCSCSDFARLQGDHDAAKQHAETALGLARGDGNPDDEGLALKQLGIIEMFDDLERSVALLEESLAIRRAGGSSRDVANSLNNLAEANRLRGNHDAAISYLLEALAMCDGMNDIEGLAMTSMTLASIELQTGHHTSAAEHLCVALEHATGIGWLEIVAQALVGAAAIALGRGLYEAGAQLIAVAETILADRAIHLHPDDLDVMQETKSLLEHELGTVATEAAARIASEMTWENASALAQEVAGAAG